MTAVLGRLRFPAVAVRLTAAAATPLTLYAVAVVVGLWATSFVAFPTNEGSAYYVAVARNLVDGRGLVIDTLWSYATPPLVLPRPAFELWQPMASFVAALPMALLNGSFAAAQLGGVLLGAAVAPLGWALTRDAGRALGVAPERFETLAVGAGLLASISAAVVLAMAVPDSTLPFLVFGSLACWLAPRAWSGSRPAAALALGVALGLAYLGRHEAIYIGLVVVLVGVVGARARGGLHAWRWLASAVLAGLVVVSPWFLRNLAVFGTPIPGQALDNAFLTSNEQIFAYSGRPTVAAFLEQGPAILAGNVVAALLHNIVDIVIVMAMPLGLIGLVAAFLLVRRPALRGTSLWLLLVSGALTFAIASVVFPVASLWGTFQHASGPLLLGLTVAGVLGGDTVVDYVRRRRHWKRANAWLAPLALALVAAPLAIFQLGLLARAGDDAAARYSALAAVVAQQPETLHRPSAPPVISDHPIWLSEATGLSTLALPAEAPDVVLRLANDQNALLIVISEGRGDYPAAFRSGSTAHCFVERPLPANAPVGSAIFAIAPDCRQ
jgi:hypothetical protein